TSITRRGHSIIERARRFFEDRGLKVIYGDTDSLFVHVTGEPSEDEARTRGQALASELTTLLAREIEDNFRVESKLELKFESHYLRFLMPTVRGTAKGSKKRYAGWARKKSGEAGLVLRGLEAVRTDWTALARRAQRELLRRVFTDEPYAEWLADLVQALLRGDLDDELVYTKLLRRDLGDYASESAPPHVRAARLRTSDDRNETQIAYVVTVKGPEPVNERKSPIDREHYLEKQLAPACDVVLSLLGTSFEREAGLQGSLF
ncbi:MAG TPA: DNA polymerase domain-containing protein, partial [Polyangiaceae bacterium]